MEITICRPQLTQALELITRISTKHVTLPVLQCVLLETTKDGVIAKATNLELSIEITIPCRVVEEGVVAVPAITFMQSVQYGIDDDVVLRTEEGVMVIETGKTNTSIKLISHEEFPVIKKLEGEEVQLQRELFSLGIKTAVFAASVSTIRPELGSVFVQQKKEHSMTFVATDSFRLMEKTVPQKGVVLQQSFLIPQKNASEIARLCDLLHSDPRLVVSDNLCALSFVTEGVYIISRLSTGSFPDYEQIIPKEYVSEVVLLKSDLQKAFKKTAIFLNRYQQVTLSLTEAGITLSSQNTEVGHVTDSVVAEVKGEELTLNFNQQYVVDVLQHISEDRLLLKFAGIGRPLVISGYSERSLRYLVMPMNR